MFFDKFLKNDGQINSCNKKDYHINLSAPHSDIAIKKVFRLPRICPHFPAAAPAGQAAARLPARVASGGACGV